MLLQYFNNVLFTITTYRGFNNAYDLQEDTERRGTREGKRSNRDIYSLRKTPNSMRKFEITRQNSFTLRFLFLKYFSGLELTKLR